MDDMVSLSIEDIGELKKLYKNAVKTKKHSFIFKDREVLVSYAKYMIEYLDMRIKRRA